MCIRDRYYSTFSKHTLRNVVHVPCLPKTDTFTGKWKIVTYWRHQEKVSQETRGRVHYIKHAEEIHLLEDSKDAETIQKTYKF